MKICGKCHQTFSTQGWNCPNCGWAPEIISDIPAFSPELSEAGEHFPVDLFPYETGHFWFRSRNRLILWALQKYYAHHDTICEIGCGNGFVLSGIQKAYPEARLTGTEIFAQGLHQATRRVPGAELLQMDARHLPYRDEFDVIGIFDVLEHIDEDELVLSQLFRAVKPGGGILVTVPQHSWLWSSRDERASHKRRYSREELTAKVKAAGFETRRVTSFVSVLLPLMILSRKKAATEDDNPLREFQIPRVVNYALEFMLGMELGMIRAGVPMPWGGSLLLAGRKPIL